MTGEEMRDAVLAAVQESDLDSLGNLLDGMVALYHSIDEKDKAIDTLNGKIKSLQDTNMKLFLRQTGKVPEKMTNPPDEQIDGIDAVGKFFEDVIETGTIGNGV